MSEKREFLVHYPHDGRIIRDLTQREAMAYLTQAFADNVFCEMMDDFLMPLSKEQQEEVQKRLTEESGDS